MLRYARYLWHSIHKSRGARFLIWCLLQTYSLPTVGGGEVGDSEYFGYFVFFVYSVYILDMDRKVCELGRYAYVLCK